MSSVILLVIVVAWAVVLVPMLLSKHETTNEVRSVDRFATAMRVLARRSAVSREGRYVVMPARPDSAPSVIVNGTTPFAYETAPVPQRLIERLTETPDAREMRRLTGLRRRAAARRRVLAVLGAVALMVLGLALAAAPVWWIVEVLTDLLLVAYVIHLRRETARIAARRARSDARGRRAARAAAAAEAVASARLRLPMPSNALVIEKQEDGSWHPVPVPLPTYVTAPMAPAQPSTPSRAASSGDSGAPPESTEQDLDRRLEDMERRLAVND